MARGKRKNPSGFWMIQRRKERTSKKFDPYNPYDLPIIEVGRIFLHFTPVMIKSFTLFNTNNLSETIQQEIPLKDGAGMIDTFILGNM